MNAQSFTLKPGQKAELARYLGVTPSMVSQWCGGDRPIRLEHCAGIEQLTGIRCEDLRPDVTWVRDKDTGQVLCWQVAVSLPTEAAGQPNGAKAAPCDAPGGS